MKQVFGYAVEYNKRISPAVYDSETDIITCYDLSCFMGSWEMVAGGVFFESVSGESLCDEALKQADEYCQKLKPNENELDIILNLARKYQEENK